jgi:hypothetical protein
MAARWWPARRPPVHRSIEFGRRRQRDGVPVLDHIEALLLAKGWPH